MFLTFRIILLTAKKTHLDLIFNGDIKDRYRISGTYYKQK